MKSRDFVAVDWGSTTFRAWHLTVEGTILASVSTEDGLKSVTDRDFAGVVTRTCGAWLASRRDMPIVFSGMVGSRTGWKEAPYVDCPAAPEGLVAQAVRFHIDDHPAAILPGACVRTAEGDVDVMRGEELQLLGATAMSGARDAVICIPGTHCKWAVMRDGLLVGFRTYVTGELFQLLRRHSLVGALAEGDLFDEAAFRRGLAHGLEAALAHAVFAARANALGGTLSPQSVDSYLSGVLIGAELAAQDRQDGREIVLMATGVLAERYGFALTCLGMPYRMIDAKEAARAGLVLAARALWFQAVTA